MALGPLCHTLQSLTSELIHVHDYCRWHCNMIHPVLCPRTSDFNARVLHELCTDFNYRRRVLFLSLTLPFLLCYQTKYAHIQGSLHFACIVISIMEQQEKQEQQSGSEAPEAGGPGNSGLRGDRADGRRSGRGRRVPQAGQHKLVYVRCLDM